ncbi:MAG: cell wall hydrolase [Clostridia bacterium]
MKSGNLKKYTMCFSYIFILIVLLYISLNYSNILTHAKFSIESLVYAETKSTQSSTSTNKPAKTNDMVDLLARLINGEARGESYQGQVAVGAVVLNRVKSSKFPNTISGVIYQNGQFSCVKDGQFDKPMEKDSTVYKAAKEAINGADPSNGALYFYNPKTAKSKWLFSLKTITTIGSHRFAMEEPK